MRKWFLKKFSDGETKAWEEQRKEIVLKNDRYIGVMVWLFEKGGLNYMKVFSCYIKMKNVGFIVIT